MYDVAGSDFDRKVIAESANQPVVVMFRSDSCPPCNKMVVEAPQMAFAAFAGKVKFYTVDVGVERALAAKYQATDPPRVVVFRNGEPVASIAGAQDRMPLFQFFAAQAGPGARQAYQKPPAAFEVKRPPGAELKMIGSWTIERSGDGIAHGLRADRYLRRVDEATAGRWTVSGSAALSLGYDVGKRETICYVGYSQEITRPASAGDKGFDLQKQGAKVVVEHPGGPVFMKLDGEQVAKLPDPLTLQAAETAKAVDTGRTLQIAPLQGRSRFHSVVANQYLAGIGGMTPKRFEELLVKARSASFSIVVDGHSVVLSEIALEDTQKALAYLKAERAYAAQRQNAIGLPR
ncbi:thioredoxin family protein [Reyranella sp.]|uniref:thioredoxin family protein n=1 Tax=Reyranella sp. TaxID=1929291 RepID=UPI003BA93E90